MNRKLTARVLCAILAVCMSVCVFSGCNNTSGGNSGTLTSTDTGTGTAPEYLNLDSMLPIVKEGYDVTVTCASVVRGGYTQNPEDHWIWKWWKEYGNINIEPTYYAEGAWGEQKALLFSSQRMPDFFIYCMWSPSEMVMYGQDQQLFMPLEGLIESYAPNIQALKTGDYATQFAQATCPDGHIYGVPNIAQEWLELETMQYYIRKDWLEAVNMEMPTTVDEFTEVLKAFRDKDPNGNGQKDEIPYIGTLLGSTGQTVDTLLLTAFGMNADYSYEPHITSDGKTMNIPVMEENYIHYLEYMNMLYTEGLVNNDLYSMASELKTAMIQQDRVGVTQMYNPYTFYGTEKDQYSVVEVQRPLTSQYNSEAVWPITNSSLAQGGIVISDGANYPEAIIRMFDVYYAHDGDLPMSLLFWVGPFDCEGHNDYKCKYPLEGFDPITYKYENESWTPYMPDGTDIWTYINNVLEPTTNCVTGLKYKEDEVGKLFGTTQQLPDFEMNWRNSAYANIVPYEKLKSPILFLAPDDLNRVNEIAQPIVEYIKTKEAEFISGVTPITEENLNAVREKLKTVGIEEYISILQSAYTAYLENTAE